MLDPFNDLAARVHARKKPGPAKTWYAQPHDHPAIARALQIDRDDLGGTYALLPFRYGKLAGQHRIMAAWPTPRVLTEIDEDWLNIEQVIAWCPVSGRVEFVGNPSTKLAGPINRDTTVIYADPRKFFADWAIARAAFYVEWREATMHTWQALPKERDLAPGLLMTGKPADVRWPVHTLPETLKCVGVDPREINRAILRAAKLPRAA